MMLLRIAWRNLLANRWKTVLVGTFLAIGTFILVLGNSLMDAIDASTARSIIHSMSGHLQVYDANAPEKLSIFGNMDGTRADIGFIHDFTRSRKVLESLDEVQRVIPMGIDTAVIATGNVLDVRLAELRSAVTLGETARIAPLREHIREMVALLQKQLKNAREIVDVEAYAKQSPEHIRGLERIRTPEFWESFDETPLAHLEFLENEIAPMALDGDLVWIGYIGTDPTVYRESFEGFEIVEGEPIAPGHRGFLFARHVYDKHFKNKLARRVDQIEERLNTGDTLADCEDCQTWIDRNVRQAHSIAMQLDKTAQEDLRNAIQEAIGGEESELVPVLQRLLRFDTAHARAHIALWREIVEPRILLYSIPVGEDVKITAFGRGGYPRTVAVKVYGVYRFRSLDDSPVAGSYHIMDLMTFRDLYGHMTMERKVEVEKMREASGIRDVAPEDAEAALFGDSSAQVTQGATESFEDTAGIDMRDVKRFTEELRDRVYTREEMESGVVLSAAILLRDDAKIPEASAIIEAAIQEHGLGLQVLGWREASGHVGEFVGVIRAVLHGAVLIIFLVALIILNNTLMMATLERTREIGTLRAIGAQRSLVRRMVFFETATLAVVFGGLGAVVGAGLVLGLEAQGIAPWNDVTNFLFAGEPLRPTLAGVHLGIAILATGFVSLLSTLYPAILATRVTPLEAMRAEN